MSPVVTLEGHLTESSLSNALGRVPTNASALIVDCRTMTSYTRDARTRFVQWNRDNRHRISRVAVVTENTIWHMIIAAMALASSQKMTAFKDLESAQRWVAEAGA